MDDVCTRPSQLMAAMRRVTTIADRLDDVTGQAGNRNRAMKALATEVDMPGPPCWGRTGSSRVQLDCSCWCCWLVTTLSAKRHETTNQTMANPGRASRAFLGQDTAKMGHR